MKLRTLCLSIAAFLSTMAAIPTYAAEASTAPAATPASGTHDTRSAERKQTKAANTAANKSGELSGTNTAGEKK